MIQEVNQLVDIKVGGFATTPDRKRNDQLTVIHFGLKRYLMPHCRLGSHSSMALSMRNDKRAEENMFRQVPMLSKGT